MFSLIKSERETDRIEGKICKSGEGGRTGQTGKGEGREREREGRQKSGGCFVEEGALVQQGPRSSIGEDKKGDKGS